jgi:hypothetical protein
MSIDELLMELQKNYLKSFPAKIELIERLYQSGDTKALRVEFHKLKGTGLTYGIAEVSQVGEKMELLCLFKPEHLAQGIPLAIRFLHRMVELRNKGETPLPDQDADFQTLATLAKGLDALVK